MKLLPTTVSRARARVNQADRLLVRAVHAAFPIGKRVEWHHSRGSWCAGPVVDLSDHGPGVKVRNEATGREYWIGLWQMESRVGGER